MTLGSKQALSLSLALHELATNASKYGALSLADGRVEISWAIVIEDQKPLFQFEWREIGGPPVTAPTRRGFGSRLIERVLAADFGVDPELSFAPEGLVFRREGTDVETQGSDHVLQLTGRRCQSAAGLSGWAMVAAAAKLL